MLETGQKLLVPSVREFDTGFCLFFELGLTGHKHFFDEYTGSAYFSKLGSRLFLFWTLLGGFQKGCKIKKIEKIRVWNNYPKIARSVEWFERKNEGSEIFHPGCEKKNWRKQWAWNGGPVIYNYVEHIEISIFLFGGCQIPFFEIKGDFQTTPVIEIEQKWIFHFSNSSGSHVCQYLLVPPVGEWTKSAKTPDPVKSLDPV